MAENVSARVFISCGQRTGEERAIAQRIASVMEGLGFQAYVAVQDQTLKGLRENLFWHLDHSEYYLFVDFKREQLANSLEHRGSLFSHQELAIASYLGLDPVVLQEEGVIGRDGLLGNLQANAQTFGDRNALPGLVTERVKAAEWRNEWRNELSLEIHDPPYTDTYDPPNVDSRRRNFHLRVQNLHDRKVALNCVATVEAISRGPQSQTDLRQVELHWAGTSVSQVLIPPKSAREVDLGFVPVLDPGTFHFNSFTTSPQQYLPPLHGAGEHIVTYLVASATFPPVRFKAKISLGDLQRNTIEDVWVERANLTSDG